MKKNCVAPRAHRLTLVLLVLLIQLARGASHQVTYLSSERPPGVLPPCDQASYHSLARYIASALRRDQPLNSRGYPEVCRVQSGTGGLGRQRDPAPGGPGVVKARLDFPPGAAAAAPHRGHSSAVR